MNEDQFGRTICIFWTHEEHCSELYPIIWYPRLLYIPHTHSTVQQWNLHCKVGALTMLCGILLIALPVAIVGSKYSLGVSKIGRTKHCRQNEKLNATSVWCYTS